jgi:hypothetical protein
VPLHLLDDDFAASAEMSSLELCDSSWATASLPICLDAILLS